MSSAHRSSSMGPRCGAPPNRNSRPPAVNECRPRDCGAPCAGSGRTGTLRSVGGSQSLAVCSTKTSPTLRWVWMWMSSPTAQAWWREIAGSGTEPRAGRTSSQAPFHGPPRSRHRSLRNGCEGLPGSQPPSSQTLPSLPATAWATSRACRARNDLRHMSGKMPSVLLVACKFSISPQARACRRWRAPPAASAPGRGRTPTLRWWTRGDFQRPRCSPQ